MANRFAILAREIKQLPDTVNRLIGDIFRDFEAEIVELNTQSQLFEKGINADSVSIKSYRPYRPLTIQLKKLKGQPTDRVTLRDDGDFYNSVFLNIGKSDVFFDATDSKTEDLIEKYGEDILGLTLENVEIVRKDIVLPELIRRLRLHFARVLS